MEEQHRLPVDEEKRIAAGNKASMKPFWDEERGLSRTAKITAVVVAVVAALVCAFPVASWLSSPGTHAGTIAALDEKAQTVTGMVSASVAASAAITALPGDLGTPIAEKLVDLSGDFAVVLGTIYLEKYLLTLLCLVAFRILMPLACLCFIGWVLLPAHKSQREVAKTMCAKLVLFALAAAIVVPASVYASSMIESTYAIDTELALTEATDAAQQAQDSSLQQTGTGDNSSSGDTQQSNSNNAQQSNGNTDSSQSGSWLDSIKDSIGGFVSNAYNVASSTVENATSTLTQGVQDALAQAQEAFNKLVETLAVMVIVNCVIPILVLVFFIWLVNLILGTNFRLPSKPLGKATDGVKRRMRGE